MNLQKFIPTQIEVLEFWDIHLVYREKQVLKNYYKREFLTNTK